MLSWAPLMGPMDPDGPPWALMGHAILGTLSPHGPGPTGPPWALMSQALVSYLGPRWPNLDVMGIGQLIRKSKELSSTNSHTMNTMITDPMISH